MRVGPSSIAVRPYVEADLDRLLECWYEAAQIAHPFLDDDFFVRERRLIADEFIPASA